MYKTVKLLRKILTSENSHRKYKDIMNFSNKSVGNKEEIVHIHLRILISKHLLLKLIFNYISYKCKRLLSHKA
jgi:hypothetical protein